MSVSLFLKKIQVIEYIPPELSNLFIPLACQSLSAMFYIYGHHDIWKRPKEKQLHKCFKELDIRIKALRKERAVLTIIAHEVKRQNCVLVIGDD